MPYKIPRIPTFSGLKGIDKRIQEIQLKMADISWLQYSFGLCDKVLSDKDEIIPVCRIDDTSDPLDMRPWLDDSHESYSFWDLTELAEVNYSDNLSVRRFPALTYSVACIVVVNLDLSDTGDTYSDWFLPSKDLLNTAYTNLHLNGIGDFSTDNFYWTSNELAAQPTTNALNQRFLNGSQGNGGKSNNHYVRPFRSFTSSTSYSLGDTGPGGGYISYINGSTYYECAASNIGTTHKWSNIADTAIGLTDTSVAASQTNTDAIIAQAGHTSSAALSCDQYEAAAISTDRKVTRSDIRNDLLTFFHQTLRFSGTLQIETMSEKDIEEIFEGYTIVDPLLFLRDQYQAFRINTLITLKQDCND